MFRNALLTKSPANKPSEKLQQFQDVPVRHLFWDPFANRTFVKVSSQTAGSLSYPEGYNERFVPFDPQEEVYVIGTKPTSRIALYKQRSAFLIKTFNQRKTK